MTQKRDHKKVLFVWPGEQYIMPTYTKIPKRLAYLGEVVTYINNNSNYEVNVIDCLNPKYSTGEVIQNVVQNDYLCLVFVARIENVTSLISLTKTIKEVKPNQKILVYGDVNNYAPNFFRDNVAADAIITCGDW